MRISQNAPCASTQGFNSFSHFAIRWLYDYQNRLRLSLKSRSLCKGGPVHQIARCRQSCRQNSATLLAFLNKSITKLRHQGKFIISYLSYRLFCQRRPTQSMSINRFLVITLEKRMGLHSLDHKLDPFIFPISYAPRSFNISIKEYNSTIVHSALLFFVHTELDLVHPWVHYVR